MASTQDLSAAGMAPGSGDASGFWRFSWPLSMALLAYLYLVSNAGTLLRDGDTYWHVAAGRWILGHGVIPATDPFSHTMPAATWTAHEWLSEIVLASAHHWGGWTLVVAVAASAFALAVALLTRALLRWLEPVYAVLFAALALFMSAGHALARPHMLAMPLMVAWTVGLITARDEERAPSPWLLLVMLAWANLHGGFTLGLVLGGAFALEALLAAHAQGRARAALRSWGLFLALALAASLVTPHGGQGLRYTWEVMVEGSYALKYIGEWQSPNFQVFQPMALWLLAGLALTLHQGLKLPPVRLLVLLGLLYLALKHARNIELLGQLAPLVLAAPFAAQWQARRGAKPQMEDADRLFLKLARPAGAGAILAGALVGAGIPLWQAQYRPLVLPDSVVPAAALRAAAQAGADRGRVLNHYDWGGYLIYSGIPAFIDGRADMYGDDFLKDYVEATQLSRPGGFEKLIARYGVTWTLLRPGTPAIALLDRLPGWRRLHTDDTAVIHVRTGNLEELKR
jgi:hypothetical protein